MPITAAVSYFPPVQARTTFPTGVSRRTLSSVPASGNAAVPCFSGPYPDELFPRQLICAIYHEPFLFG